MLFISLGSFESLKKWKEDFIRQAVSKDPIMLPFIVLRNKADKEKNRKVHTENDNHPYYETSAKEYINVEEDLYIKESK